MKFCNSVIDENSKYFKIYKSLIDICMPEDSKVGRSVVLSYRKYYLLHKRPISKWKLRGCPGWFR